jgi:hypothetical protein
MAAPLGPGVDWSVKLTFRGKQPVVSLTVNCGLGGAFMVIIWVATRFGEPPPLIVSVTVYDPGIV